MANAISPNGYIARLDGQEDWLSSENWDDFVAAVKEFGNFVMGRETYELVTKLYEGKNFDGVDCMHKIIVTRQYYKAPRGYHVVHSPQEAIKHLESKGTEKLLLIGGGKLNSEFAKAGLIDEVVLTVEPHIIGEGRPVMAAGSFELELELIHTNELSKGRVSLVYRVKKP